MAGMSVSVAVLVTMSWVSSLTLKLGCALRDGGEFTSRTITVKALVALSGGFPLSVTTVVKRFVLGPCASEGSQVMMPSASIDAPVGAFKKA